MERTPLSSFTQSFTVRVVEAAPDGAAHLPHLCRFFQEAAANHADALGFGAEPMGELRLAWVLARLYVRMTRFPLAGEQVRVTTWPSKMERASARRDFVVTGKNGERLGAGASRWAVLDVDRRRLARIPELVRQAFPGENDFAAEFPESNPGAGLDAEAVEAARHPVTLFDTDLNGHANSARLMEWALGGVGAPGARPAAIDIAYRAEAMPGDMVACQVAGGPGVFAHRLVRGSDNAICALAASWWTPPEQSGQPDKEQQP